MKFAVIDDCPVPAKLAPAIRQIKRRTGAVLNSCDRSPEAEPLLREHGKRSQRQLYADYKAGRGNPANPPGYSTHERRSDGVAYRGPRGRRLRWWQVGQDWDRPQAVCEEGRKLGYIITVTYPHSRGEAQHLNFRKQPRLRLRALRLGAKGVRVKRLTEALCAIRRPKLGTPYLTHRYRTFTADVEEAVRRFQLDHDQKADGIVGAHTRAQLRASLRYHQQRRAKR